MIRPTLENVTSQLSNLNFTPKDKLLTNDILISQVFFSLMKLYGLLIRLEEKRILNNHIPQLENDLQNLDKYINKYKQLADSALDDNSKWRHTISYATLEEFKKMPKNALFFLKLIISINYFIADDLSQNYYYELYLKNDPKQIEASERNVKNQDLFVDLYNFLEGYQITHNRLLKSFALKIFNFFNCVSKVEKKALATQIEYLFAFLDEDIKIDSKRASNIKVIGQFEEEYILDYQSNKKTNFTDFGFTEVYNQTLLKIFQELKKHNKLETIIKIKQNLKNIEMDHIISILT